MHKEHYRNSKSLPEVKFLAEDYDEDFEDQRQKSKRKSNLMMDTLKVGDEDNKVDTFTDN